MNNKKTIIFLVAIGLLIILALFVLPTLPKQASAQEEGTTFTGAITGWMWSSNIGWIKLDSSVDNGVKMTKGVLSGFAWSPSIGWIDFNPTDTDYPSNPPNGVQVESTPIDEGGTVYAVSGWARACSVFATDCSGELKTEEELGSWDGWIRMDEGATYDTSTKIFSGYAWGGLNIGWAQFNSPESEDVPKICATNPALPGCGVVCFNCGGGGLSVSCSANPTTANVNEIITYTATVINIGIGSTYDWEGDLGTGEPDSGSNIFETSYNSAGIYKVIVEALDESGNSLGSAQCNDPAGVTITQSCVADGGTPPDPNNSNCCVGACYDSSVDQCLTSACPLSECTITKLSDYRTIVYNQDDNLNESAPKVKISIDNCNASGLKLISDVYNGSSLNSSFYLVCSDPNSLEKPSKSAFTAEKCASLSGGSTYWVWANPSILPVSSFSQNKFNLKLQNVGGELLESSLWLQLTYRQSGTP